MEVRVADDFEQALEAVRTRHVEAGILLSSPLVDGPTGRPAVMIAPTATSRHSRSQSGSTLKTATKRNEISARETKTFKTDRTTPPNGTAALI
jgi:hypothetical protein